MSKDLKFVCILLSTVNYYLSITIHTAVLYNMATTDTAIRNIIRYCYVTLSHF